MPDEIANVLESTNPPPLNEVVQAPVEQVEKGPTLDDTLRATFDKMKAARPVQGEDGKFIQKAGAQAATPDVAVPGQSQTGAPDPAPPVIEAPQSLPADVKAQWSTLPPTVQKFWAEREGEIHKKFTTDGERLKSLTAFEEVTTGLQDRLKQVGAPASEYFRRLGEADKLLATDGVRGLQQIAQMYGIDMAAAFQQPIGQPQGQPMDPRINALSQELSQIKSTLTAQEKAAQDARVKEADAKVETFKKDHPHFDKVESLMTKLYEPGIELDALYDMAVKAHPEVSKEIEAAKAKEAEAKALAEQKEKAAAAAKLAPFARKPGSVAASTKAGQNWEDTMKAEHSKIKARG